jgi:HSP20 family protein
MDMSRIFDQFFPQSQVTPEGHDWIPRFNIHETADKLIFETALPGMDKKNINVVLLDGVLTLTAEKTQPEISEGSQVHLTELHYGKFSRSFSIGTEVDEEKVEAKYKNGVLTIVLNKRGTKESVVRQIDVK